MIRWKRFDLFHYSALGVQIHISSHLLLKEPSFMRSVPIECLRKDSAWNVVSVVVASQVRMVREVQDPSTPSPKSWHQVGDSSLFKWGLLNPRDPSQRFEQHILFVVFYKAQPSCMFKVVHS